MYSYDELASDQFDYNLLSRYSHEDNMILMRNIVKIAFIANEIQYIANLNRCNYNNALFLNRVNARQTSFGVSVPPVSQVTFTSISDVISRFPSIVHYITPDMVSHYYIDYDTALDSKLSEIHNDIFANIVFSKKSFAALRFALQYINSSVRAYATENSKQYMQSQIDIFSDLEKIISKPDFNPDDAIPNICYVYANLNSSDKFVVNNDSDRVSRHNLYSSLSRFLERKLNINLYKENYVKAVNIELLYNLLLQSTENQYSLYSRDKSAEILFSRMADAKIQDQALVCRLYQTYILYNGKNIDTLKKFDSMCFDQGREFKKEREKQYNEINGYKISLDSMVKSGDANIRYLAASIMEKDDPRFEKMINDRSRNVFEVVLRKIDINKVALMLGSKKLNSPNAKKILSKRMES